MKVLPGEFDSPRLRKEREDIMPVRKKEARRINLLKARFLYVSQQDKEKLSPAEGKGFSDLSNIRNSGNLSYENEAFPL